MKTLTLLIGLVHLIGSACCYLSGCFFLNTFGADWYGLTMWGLFTLGGIVNGIAAANEIMDALFGRNGLVCDLFPAPKKSQGGAR